MMNKVVFLDRDGVINRDSPNYIKTVEEFAFLPGSLQALRLLHEAGFTLMVITNQSAINRGLTPEAEVRRIHALLGDTVTREGGRIKDIFYCPHTPEENCDCRKPKPGLITRAQKRHGIDLSTAVMIGDSAKDIACGKNAGCRKTVLVKTGNGERAEAELAADGTLPDVVADDLYRAAQWLVSDA